jgi:ribosomal protein S1
VCKLFCIACSGIGISPLTFCPFCIVGLLSKCVAFFAFFFSYSLPKKFNLTDAKVTGIIVRWQNPHLQETIMSKSTKSVPPNTPELKSKVTGKVLKTTLAGVLVDFGHELPGVIHISQLQKESVNKVEDVVEVGQTIEAWVRRIKKDRIELTLIQPLAMEWNEIKPETVVMGKVVRLENYGAFVDFGAERPGLIHVSEIAQGYIKNPSDIVKEGDEVEAVVLDVNRRKKQIRLSMKALQPEIEEVSQSLPKSEKKGRGKRKPKKENVVVADDEPKEPEMTAMQIAWQEALDRAKSRKDEVQKEKRQKSGKSSEQEELLSRTLEDRVPTGG